MYICRIPSQPLCLIKDKASGLAGQPLEHATEENQAQKTPMSSSAFLHPESRDKQI